MGITASEFNKLGATGKVHLLNDYYLTAEQRAAREEPTVAATHVIELKITGGSAMFIGSDLRLPYNDITITIEPNSCKDIAVHAKKHPYATNLAVCYWGNELQLDPSMIKPEFALASARIFYSSIWRDFTYKNINTFGYVSFKNINIRIQTV